MTSLAGIRSLVFGDAPEPVKNVSFLFPISPYSTLKFKKRQGYKKRIINKTLHRGFDTETNHKGDIVLLSDDKGDNCWYPDLTEILAFLTQAKYRESINWFFNITFDVESILKMLPEAELEEMLEDNETEYKGFKLAYLPHKYFKISTKGKHVVDYWDIAQFYLMSLENASLEYLKDSKGVADIKGLMEYVYYDKVKKVVSDYCIHDCDLTRRLGERMHEGVKSCNMPFSKPYSVASLSETAFLQQCDIPEYLDAPLGVNKYFYWAYYGGWFELFKRGYQSEAIYEYDINSAYPFAMLDLPDTRDLRWERVKRPSKDTVIGVYLIAFSPKRQSNISPVQIRTEALSVHPQASGVRYVTDDELEIYQDVYKVKVISGFEAFGDHIRYPFREFVQKLYSDKSKYKNKDAAMYMTVKKCLNGFYGKNIQRTGGKIGNCFNPVYAAKITASCRKQIWNAVKDHQDKVIGIQTDSCMMTEEIDIDEGTGLGQWEGKEFTEGIFLLSGVYEMLGDVKKTKIRGYDTKMALMDMLKAHPTKDAIEVAKEKPLHLKQAVGWKKWDVSQTNEFVTDIKTISCKYDLKRVWKGDCENWSEFCRDQWESEPFRHSYESIFESEYIKKSMDVMKESLHRYRDGEGGLYVRGVT